MIWSEKDLVDMLFAGEKTLVEQVMAKLDEPENQDIFLPRNFSLLWGILGVVGLEGASAEARKKIWHALCDNGVVKAFELGILADYLYRLEKDVTDDRLYAWRNIDNSDAGVKFSQSILEQLLISNQDLCAEIFATGYQPWSFAEKLDLCELSVPLKLYLEQIRMQIDDIRLDNSELYFAYKKFLQKLVLIIIHMRRELTEAEKKYFCIYFQDIINNQFNRNDIGMTDRFWTRLMLRKNINELSEIEYKALRAYNQDIIDFIAPFEEEEGFYEECAIQSVYGDVERASALTDRCLLLAKKTSICKGVVFAKVLVNLGQINSAILVLKMLARYGQATMMTCYLNCLLPLAKDTEDELLQILCTNLAAVKKNAVEYMNLAYQEYVARFYLQAVRAFIDDEKYVQGVALLKEMVLQHWFDGLSDLVPDFMVLANRVLEVDDNSRDDLLSISNILNLSVFDEGGVCRIGYGKGENLYFSGKSFGADNIAFSNYKSENNNEYASYSVSEQSLEDEKVLTEDVENDGNGEEISKINETDYNEVIDEQKDIKNNILDVNPNDIDEHFEQIKQMADTAIQEETVIHAGQIHTNQGQSIESNNVNDVGDGISRESAEDLLNVSSRDVDNPFEYIKNLADTTVRKVEKLRDNIKEAHALAKIKWLANKIKFLHKNND